MGDTHESDDRCSCPTKTPPSGRNRCLQTHRSNRKIIYDNVDKRNDLQLNPVTVTNMLIVVWMLSSSIPLAKHQRGEQ